MKSAYRQFLEGKIVIAERHGSLNQRCRSYINFMSTSVTNAQKRALEDFKGFYQPGEYVAVKGAEKEGPFFVKAGDEQKLLA